MNKIVIICICVIFYNCKGNAQEDKSAEFKITKPEQEWKSQLTDKEYYVLRKAGTERAFTSPLNKNHKEGVYTCKGCDTPLFESSHKFNSGTGWPSFDRPINSNVAYSYDSNIGYKRIEVHCAICGGHLGHVFNDGPTKTTGKRYCINGISLKFIDKDEKK